MSVCKWSVQVNGYCPYKEMFNMIKNDFGGKERCEGKACLQILLDATGTQSELELIKSLNLTDWLKPEGPANSVKLLNNFNIDKVLKDFSIASVKNNPGNKFTNGPFYHVPFDMFDFMKMRNSELRNIDFIKLHDAKFRTFGCVLNTDKWSGPGKHWVCIFGTIPENLAHAGNNFTGEPVRVEYFNSSGNGLKKYYTLKDWSDEINKKVALEIREVNHREIQKSETECGVWCLFYIKSRLEGQTPEFYIDVYTDTDMINGRKDLFISF